MNPETPIILGTGYADNDVSIDAIHYLARETTAVPAGVFTHYPDDGIGRFASES